MLFNSLLPALPTPMVTIIYIVAALGAVMSAYSIFVEKEDRSDLMRAIGAAGLLVYAAFIGSRLMMVAMGGVVLASLVEFIEIYIGLHKHSPTDLAEFKKHMWSGRKSRNT